MEQRPKFTWIYSADEPVPDKSKKVLTVAYKLHYGGNVYIDRSGDIFYDHDCTYPDWKVINRFNDKVEWFCGTVVAYSYDSDENAIFMNSIYPKCNEEYTLKMLANKIKTVREFEGSAGTLDECEMMMPETFCAIEELIDYILGENDE